MKWTSLRLGAAGVVVASLAYGGARAGGARPVPVNPHVDWCARQYRSYNPYDNSFQPFRGPRRLCRSPYGG